MVCIFTVQTLLGIEHQDFKLYKLILYCSLKEYIFLWIPALKEALYNITVYHVRVIVRGMVFLNNKKNSGLFYNNSLHD